MLNPWYITGFCDSSAVFTYSRAGNTFSLYFSIRHDQKDQQLVEQIQDYFKVGKIYGSNKRAVYYRVNKINELLKIIEHFDKYPLQSPQQQKAFLAWKEMVQYKAENFRSTDLNKLQNLAAQISNLDHG